MEERDLIRRADAISALGEEPDVWFDDDGYEHGLRDQWRCDVNAINTVPSAQPEIIRCKECEHYHPSYCEIWSKYGTVQTREMGYCYMAERRGRCLKVDDMREGSKDADKLD